jgi:hypothetical protein
MRFCAIARKYNAIGVSYWDPDKVKKEIAAMRADGDSEAEIKAYNSGLTAAMAQACPSVW